MLIPRRAVLLALVLFVISGPIAARLDPPGWRDQTQLPTSGTATYYNPGVMDQVLAYRIQVGDVTPCSECVGAVALLRAGDIGRLVWLDHDGFTTGPYLVIDCPTPWDYLRLVNTGWAVDVAYTQAAFWQMVGGQPVTVMDRPPAQRRRGEQP